MPSGTCEITITVTEKNGQWIATASPDPATAYVGEGIDWLVPAMTPEVSVGDFKLKSQPNKEPLEGSSTTEEGLGKTKKIKGKVKDRGFAPVYKYNIYVGSQLAADPDVQIKER